MVGISTEDKGHYFYTDASQIIPEISVPFVIAGPGDDALAHCINEHISLESVRRYANCIRNIWKNIIYEEVKMGETVKTKEK